MPTLPKSDHPSRKEWLKVAKKYIRDVDVSELIIIGHSLGVVTALDLIQNLKKKIHSFISVSGFAIDYGAALNSYFLKEKDTDVKKIKKLIGNSHVVYGNDDPYVPQEVLKDLATKLGVKPIIVKKGGHINTTSGYTKLPLLLDLLEKQS